MYKNLNNCFCFIKLFVGNGGYLIGDDFFHEPIKHAAIETFGENNIKPHGEDKFIWIK